MKKNYLILLVLLIFAGAISMWGCKKDSDDSDTPTDSVPDATRVKDVEGNVYHAITIGTQTWLKENLRTTKYRDGSAIANVLANPDWGALFSGSWCYYNHAQANNAIYGKLYNFYAVSDSKKLAPTGWHVPSLAEWNTLITYLGGNVVAGGKLKESGTTHWIAPNQGATNSSNFTALPGGARYADGSFFQLNSEGYYWTSTAVVADSATNMYLTFLTAEAYNFKNSKRYGCSVRCIKD
jgi:uncharacterized protein (TIGR02145 family)